jgi:hypothetical protein
MNYIFYYLIIIISIIFFFYILLLLLILFDEYVLDVNLLKYTKKKYIKDFLFDYYFLELKNKINYLIKFEY